MPRSPDGWQGWTYSLLAIFIGLLVAAFRLLYGYLGDDRLRLAESIVAEIEIPVLAVIPELVPAQAATEVRWQFIFTTMLCIVTGGVHAFFMIYLG